MESRQLASNLLGHTHRPPQAYLNSLEDFINRCGINELIHEARAEINEEKIKETIKSDESQCDQNSSNGLAIHVQGDTIPENAPATLL